MISNGIQSYRRTNVVTSNPLKLVLMCYEKTLDNLKLAKQKILDRDYEEKSNAFIKAKEIIEELLCSLDFEKGGAIARNLESLYKYMLKRIMHADLNNDMQAIDEVMGMLSELESAWEDVYLTQRNQAQSHPGILSNNRSSQTAGPGLLESARG